MSKPNSTEYSPSVGFWTPWIPTLANISVGAGSVYAIKSVNGKTVNVFIELILGTGFTIGVNPTITGFPSMDGARWASSWLGSGLDVSAGTLYQLRAYGVDANTVRIYHSHSPTSEVTMTVITSADPVLWAVGDILTLSGTYKTT
jgi:hypothetical protein